jgi:hypothetical protein
MLSTISVTAQYGNYGGMRNSGIPNSEPTASKPTPAEIEKHREERIAIIMNKLKTDLTLDELQFIAIKIDITNSYKSMEIVLKSENSEEDKGKELKAIQEKTEKSILSYLNAIQREKYELSKLEKNNKKEDKKKKKKEKDTE